MNASELLKVAKTFAPVPRSLVFDATTVDRRTRRNVCKSARLLADKVAALPVTGKESTRAIESAAELDAMLMGFDALQAYCAAAKSERVAERMQLRARLLARRANLALGELVTILTVLARDDAGTAS